MLIKELGKKLEHSLEKALEDDDEDHNDMTNLDTLSNIERMKIALQLVKTYRRVNYPDAYSILLIDGLINQLQLEGFSKEEIDYAIKRGYTKCVRKYVCRKEQLPGL